jgi:hypothetical protein
MMGSMGGKGKARRVSARHRRSSSSPSLSSPPFPPSSSSCLAAGHARFGSGLPLLSLHSPYLFTSLLHFLYRTKYSVRVVCQRYPQAPQNNQPNNQGRVNNEGAS